MINDIYKKIRTKIILHKLNKKISDLDESLIELQEYLEDCSVSVSSSLKIVDNIVSNLKKESKYKET